MGLFLSLTATPIRAGSNPGNPAQEVEPFPPASVHTPTGTAEDQWKFVFNSYLFLGAMDGEVSAAGLTAELDAPAKALLDNLEFGAAARFEIGKDRSEGPSLAVPQDPGAYLMVRINTSSQEQPQWRKKVEVFIRNDASRPTVVGIERE